MSRKITKIQAAKSRSLAKMEFEKLECKNLLAANLFVDFGDNFPAGTLTTTQGAFRDVANDAVPANRILGTTLNDGMGNFNAGTTLNIVAQTFTTTARAQMMAVVERAYEALDVNVVELTAVNQMTVDGRSVAGATNMMDVINTLRGGNAAWKDAYIFVGTFVVDPGGANQQIYTGGGGLSPGGSNGTVLDTTDLSSATNTHDDVAVVYSNGGFSNNTLNNISHEAGHLFGLRHGITNRTGTTATNLFHQAEIMSYRNTNNTTSSYFARFPMIRGDSNSPQYSDGGLMFNAAARTITRPAMAGDFDDANLVNGLSISITGTGSNDGTYVIQNVTPAVLTLTPAATLVNETTAATIRSLNTTNYNDLAARMGQVTTYDQLRFDGNVLADPNLTFVSGTGAHDIITITRNGPVADVTVQAFGDSGYTMPITVPGEADSTFSFSIPLTQTILVQAGDSDDRIIINGELGVDLRIDGMLGNDTLWVDGAGAATAIYRPNMAAPVGVDLVDDFGGEISIGGNLIEFNNFEPSQSTVVLTDFTHIDFVPQNSEDSIQIGNSSFAGINGDRISGSSGGVQMVPLEFDMVTSINIDTAAFDFPGSDADVISLNDGFRASGLTDVALPTGTGADIFQLLTSDLSLPVGGGTILFVGGAGIDVLDDESGTSNLFEITSTNNGMLDGLLTFNAVETLDGDGNADEFRFSAAGRLDGFIDGEAGDNHLNMGAIVAPQNFTLNTLGSLTGFDGQLASNLVLGGFQDINEITASSAGSPDQVEGVDLPATWALNNSNAEYNAGGETLFLHNFESYGGGNSADQFNVASNDQARTIDGGGAVDTLRNASGAAATFVMDAFNTGNFNTLLAFSSVESLTGDVAEDEFRFINSGFLSNEIEGGLGNDHFNYAAMNSQGINLTGANANGYIGSVALGNLVASGFEGINQITGSIVGATDQLNGLDSASNWMLNNAAGSYMAGGFLLGLENFETFNGGASIDNFDVLATSYPVNLNGNDGQDSFILASTAPTPVGGNVSALNGVVNVDGGNGMNTLVVSDITGNGNGDVRVTTNSITGLAPATINFFGEFPGNGTEGVTVWGSDSVADVFTVDSFLPANTLNIQTFGGNDLIQSTVDALGNMRLDGNEGSDVVEIHMINDTRRIDAQDTGTVGTDRLTLFGLTAADEIVVRPTSVARNINDRVWHDSNTENLEVMSRGGDDIFNIAGSDAGEVLMQAGDGNDFARIINTGNANRMEFLGGRDNDRIRVRETNISTMTIVNGQHDTDRIFVGSNLTDNDGSLDRIRGPLSTVGGNNSGGAEDRLYVNDRATAMGQIYKITDSEITALSMRVFNTMSVDQFEVVRLDGTDQADEFQVTPSHDVRFVIGGNLPTRHGIACADEGDFLNLVADGSSGRRLYLTDRANGNGTWAFTNGFQTVNFTSIEKFNHVARLALGSDAFLTGRVNVLDAETRESLFTIQPYEDWFTGGVRVATGDVTHDGIPDIVVAPGAGREATIRIYDGVDGHEVSSFLAYDSKLWDGALLAVGDVGGDCGAEIVTTTGPGRGYAEVRVWRPDSGGNYQMVDHFLPFDSHFTGGASVAIGDLDGDDIGDIAVAALHGQAHVAVFKGGVPGGASELARFVAFGEHFYGGAHVAVGNLGMSDTPELIISTGHNVWDNQFDSLVHIYDGDSLPYSPGSYVPPGFSFHAFEQHENPDSSTRLVGKDYDLDGMIDELFASHGPSDNDSTIKVFDPVSMSLIDSIFESDMAFDHGVFVG